MIHSKLWIGKTSHHSSIQHEISNIYNEFLIERVPHKQNYPYITPRSHIATSSIKHSSKQSTIIVFPTCNVCKGQISEAHVIIVRHRGRIFLTLQELPHFTHSILSTLTCAPSNRGQGKDAMVESHSHKLMRRVCRIIPILSGCVLNL